MNFKVLLPVILLALVVGYTVAFRQEEKKVHSLKKSHESVIKELSNKYEEKIASISVASQTDNIFKSMTIDTTVTTINSKPNGEKTFTQIVNKSHKKEELKKEVSVTSDLLVGVNAELSDKTFNVAANEEDIKTESNSSTYHYMLGISKSKLVDKDKNLTDGLIISGGVRLGTLPLMLTTACELKKDFYNSFQVGAQYLF